jgi:glycerol-3-phosphate dehydrogenase
MFASPQRNVARLTEREFDLLIIGGGIHGATLAREAARQGLTVALVERADFCAATSASSLKILHGGIRYLQQGNLPRVRQSVRERRTMLQIAPHLVDPLPCAMPTYGHGMKSREVMFCGLLAYNLLSGDRNRGVAPGKALPRCHIGSRSDWLSIAPGLDNPRYTGAAFWHDARVHSTERLGWGFIEAAIQAGATAVNYVDVTGFLRRGRDVTGVTAIDRTTGKTLSVAARMTVNNTGPWVKDTLGLLGEAVTAPSYRCAVAMNVVLRRQLLPNIAVGLTAYREGWKSGRLFFFVPWRGRTMVGTYLRSCEGGTGGPTFTREDCRAFISNLNLAFPSACLETADIAFIHAGLMPAADVPVAPNGEPDLLNHVQILDHGRSDGISGLMTVLGVKWTTARDVAERTLSAVRAKLGRTVPAVSSIQPLPGGDRAEPEATVQEAMKAGVSETVARHLARHYGTACQSVLRAAQDDPGLLAPLGPATHVTGAEVRYAVREEMALTLPDVVLRRTDLGTAGLPDDATLQRAGSIMARELGWDAARLDRELSDLRALPCWPSNDTPCH